jgi:hypothetical protein
MTRDVETSVMSEPSRRGRPIALHHYIGSKQDLLIEIAFSVLTAKMSAST